MQRAALARRYRVREEGPAENAEQQTYSLLDASGRPTWLRGVRLSCIARELAVLDAWSAPPLWAALVRRHHHTKHEG